METTQTMDYKNLFLTSSKKNKKMVTRFLSAVLLSITMSPVFGGGTYLSILDFKNCRSGWLTSDYDIYENDPEMLKYLKDAHEQMLKERGSSDGALVGGLYNNYQNQPNNESPEKQEIVCSVFNQAKNSKGQLYIDIACYGDKDRPLSGTTFRSFHDPASEWYKAVYNCISGCDQSVVSALYSTSSEEHDNEMFVKEHKKYCEHCGIPY